jgi:hypothetical protein
MDTCSSSATTKIMQSEMRERKDTYFTAEHSYSKRRESRVCSSALAKLTRLLAHTHSMLPLLGHPDLRRFHHANLAHHRFRALSKLEQRKNAALRRLGGQRLTTLRSMHIASYVALAQYMSRPPSTCTRECGGGGQRRRGVLSSVGEWRWHDQAPWDMPRRKA